MTGMQAARLRAESLGRKAKVFFSSDDPDPRGSAPVAECGALLILCRDSLPTRTMSYWSLCPREQSLCGMHANCTYREFSSKDLRSVGNYTLGRLIGKGSFGKVYLATHKLTNGSKVRHRELAHWWGIC